MLRTGLIPPRIHNTLAADTQTRAVVTVHEEGVHARFGGHDTAGPSRAEVVTIAAMDAAREAVGVSICSIFSVRHTLIHAREDWRSTEIDGVVDVDTETALLRGWSRLWWPHNSRRDRRDGRRGW